MASRLNPYISFPGTAREAMEFYESVFGGGTVVMPLERQMWGDDFGMLVDRFGIQWMVNIAGSAA
jgi:PhnB protein